MLQAFKLMRKKRVGAIPIVDSSGIKVVGNISIRDVQFLLTAPEIYHDYRFVAPPFLVTVVSFIVHYQNVLCFVVRVLNLQYAWSYWFLKDFGYNNKLVFEVN